MALATGLLSYYKCDENAASTAVDDAYSTNDGTATTNTSNLYNATGKLSSCFDFDGSTEYVTIPDPIDGLGAFSTNAWVKSDTTGGDGCIIGADATFRMAMGYPTAGKFGFFVHNAADTRVYSISTTGVSTAAWQMVTFTYDGTNQRVYIDGTLENTDEQTGNVDTGGALTIGAWSGLTKWDGDIDEVGLWSRALSSDEITALYNSGTGITYPFPVDKTVEISVAQTLSLAGETSKVIVLDSPLTLSSSLTGNAPVPEVTIFPSTLELTLTGLVIPILAEPDTLILKLLFKTPSLNILDNTNRNPNYGTKSTKIISNLDIPDGIGGVMNLLPQDYSNVLSKKRVGLGML